jgi:alpha-beta hydrolase superfamily lysophospholipase
MKIKSLLAACFFVFCLSNTAAADSHDITFTTTDAVTIRATLSMPQDRDGKAAAIILIHQGGSNRQEWSALTPELLQQGYIVLAYDVRGHGDSDPVDSIRKLFNDPQLAPLDLHAAINFLRELPEVNSNRLAVIGASIGANLAAMASSQMNIKTAVAISAKTSAVYNLAGQTSLSLRSVFFISSAGDQGGRRAAWAEELFNQTSKPHRLEIVKYSSRHGVGIFADQPEVRPMILAWLQDTL